MPTNPDYEYSNALKKYHEAQTDVEKLQALKFMLSKAPNHKSSQTLRADIKNKIAKLKSKLEKQKKQTKKGHQFILKKEGAATIALVGTTNTGKSTLLKQLTGAKAEINSYEYTTKKPEIGIADYYGIKLQFIEIPSIFENFEHSPKGPTYLSIIKQCDLIVLFFKTPQEKNMLSQELDNAEAHVSHIIYNNQKDLLDQIWKRLPIIKVRTKMPGKDPDYPPVALPKDSTIKDLAEHIHKDFLKNFKFARVWGSSKFLGQMQGLNYQLHDDDIVEFHLK
ncbi:MAG: GTPase [Nanoarchaeota archaeon]